MSGPWDRPSSPSSDDRDWPTEDLETSRPRDPWSSDDPWQESTGDPSPGWDVWPPPAPAPDDYVIEEPEQPSSDPWAESWADDVPGMPFANDAASAQSPAAPADGPRPETPPPAPRIEPWAPDADPWGAATVDPWRPAEPWPDEPRPTDDDAPFDAADSGTTFEPAHPPKPDLPEPAVQPPFDPDREIQPDHEIEPEHEIEAERAPDWEVDEEEEVGAEPEPEPERVARVEAPVEEPPAQAVEPALAPTLDEPAAHDEPAGEPAAATWEADLWGTEPEVEPDRAPAVEHEDAAELETAPAAELEPDWQPEPWSGHAEPTQVLPADWTPPPPMRDDRALLAAEAGRVRTSLAGREATDEDDELTEQPSTAEQAVPWLIGVILLLAGMVIVLLALIFAGDASLGGSAAVPSASAAAFEPASSSGTPEPTVVPSPTAAPSISAAPTSTAAPAPEYGPLEMIYQGRSAARAPIYLLHRDFTVEGEPEVLAQDPNLDVRAFAWAPDGTVGAGLYADLLISVEPGEEKRTLGDGIVSVTFGEDASTVYAARQTEDGADDVVTVLAIDFASGETTELATVSYPRPTIEEEEVVREAQFADEGGTVRLYWMEGGMLRLWSLGAGSWEIDPSDGEVTELDGQQPVLWSPGGVHRITLTLNDGVTGIRLHDGDDEEPIAETSIEGIVSHVRWSPDGKIISFTVGRPTSGGVLQDLYAWYLGDGEAPMQLTDTGAAFGAEWRGATPRWEAE